MGRFVLAMCLVAACSKSNDSAPAPAAAAAAAQAQNTDASHAVRKLAFESYPMWASRNPDKACPAKIDELEGGAANDPWGHPFKMFCGANLPPGAKGTAIISFGPDGKEGTADDLKSWE
jgi:hypothetical protein